jgi:hypothetical protein
MKRLALTLVIFGALASVSRAQAPPPAAAPIAQPGVASINPIESCDGCVEGGKGHFFHHHSWNLFGHGHSWGLLSHKDGQSSLFGGGPKAQAPAGEPAFPTHPYARGPRDFFMYE